MIRIATTLWFVVLSLLGPQACCCTFSKLMAAKSESAQTQNHDATKHSCCRDHHPAGAKTPAKKPGHRHEPDQCPCKKGSDKQRALPSPLKSFDDGTILQLLESSFAPSLAAFPLTANCPGVRKVCEGDWRTRPFLSTEDILHLLHMLRC